MAPLPVLDFLCIYPSADGKGRVSRLLTLLLLCRLGHQVGRYISLDRITEESKETCYEALDEGSRHRHEGRHDSQPWLDHFWGVLPRAYIEFTERVGGLNRGAGSEVALVREAEACMIGPFAPAGLEAQCPGVSLPTIKRELAALRDEGLLLLDGRRRGARRGLVSRRGRKGAVLSSSKLIVGVMHCCWCRRGDGCSAGR